MRSAKYVSESGANLWKLFLRDGLNLYGAILVVNLANMLFWFIITPTGPADTIKTIITRCAPWAPKEMKQKRLTCGVFTA